MFAVICAFVPLRPNYYCSTSEGRAINPSGGTQQRAPGFWLTHTGSQQRRGRSACGRGRGGGGGGRQSIADQSVLAYLGLSRPTERGRAIVISQDTVYSPRLPKAERRTPGAGQASRYIKPPSEIIRGMKNKKAALFL